MSRNPEELGNLFECYQTFCTSQSSLPHLRTKIEWFECNKIKDIMQSDHSQCDDKNLHKLLKSYQSHCSRTSILNNLKSKIGLSHCQQREQELLHAMRECANNAKPVKYNKLGWPIYG